MVSPSSRRACVAYVQERHDVSERRACRVFDVARSSQRYRSAQDDVALRTRLKELARQRCRFGYRRLHVLLCREGWAINLKKTCRIYGEEGLSVTKRKGRKRAVGTGRPLPTAQRVNPFWSLDFMSDALEDAVPHSGCHGSVWQAMP